ncbi:MAG: CPBP family intramembrane metalloprotease [Nitrospirae bacterium]|nr:CPBP family intramembrane metalloprotease [Nitrospirota bacterium]
MLGLSASFIILIPFYVIFSSGRTFTPITINSILIQLFAVSFPEEVFFRGFLQDLLGNNVKAVLIVSLMFAITHLPGLLFYGDIYAPLTFFPSIIMGLLYMKTSNVLPSTIFHFLANVVFTFSHNF